MYTFIPHRLSFRIALLIAFCSAILSMVLFHYLNTSAIWLPAISVFIVTLLSGYLIINISLEKKFYSKLQQIYRNIIQLRSKTTSRIPKKISDEKLFPEIDQLLFDWEKENKDEIVHLKELEVFRKEFLGNVSHELKTPIFTIQGYIHTLMDGGIEDNEINQLYLGKAAKSIDRMISIVDDLESISRLEAGELILEMRTFDINDLIEDVIESLELRAKENNVTFSVIEDNTRQNYVYADKERIRQVLVNLLVNSVKYGKKNGLTTLKITDHGDFITVEIADNGIGIERHHLGRLFERFYRVDKSRSRVQGGTGLGLAIVKHIIEAHGEKISVDSLPGIGTTFTFTVKKSR